MSRRRGEFEHRTSIFEGAFRAWSHLGGLAPEDVESRPAAELDPLTNPIENDPRLAAGGSRARNPDGTPRREYPYEPLPRSGLAHPYVQAILSPWLGPDADNEAIQLGLTTLRTWWQHRRKGESGSAIAALGTEKMKGVVEGYTRHFFTLAHCLVANDKEQPPRTLHGRMKELDKLRSKRTKKRTRGGNEDKSPLVGPAGLVSSLSDTMSAQINADLTDSNLTPLERLHAAQRRQLAESDFSQSLDLGAAGSLSSLVNIKGKCVPGKIDLPGVVDAVTRNATQLAHRGVGPATVSSGGFMSAKDQYGDLDANKTPVVFVSGTGDIMIAMKIDGITCAHCVKIVETVLKGCNGSKSPIEGLLDATADRSLYSVIIKMDQIGSAKRVAFEAARNLAMVGYTATAKDMRVVGQNGDKNAATNLNALYAAFAAVGASDGKHIFDWTFPCSCPDTGVLQRDCARHSQMNSSVFEAFDARKQQVTEYLLNSGGMQYGVESLGNEHRQDTSAAPPGLDSAVNPSIQPDIFENALRVDQRMDFFGMESPNGEGLEAPIMSHAMAPPPMQAPPPPINPAHIESHKAQRNPSVISYGNGLRHMSLTSETTFGRAMSGLSALSIDWENLEDFDVEVDHSAHITNSPSRLPTDHGPRRASIRRSFFAHNAAAAAAVAGAMSGEASEGAHVSFKE